MIKYNSIDDVNIFEEKSKSARKKMNPLSILSETDSIKLVKELEVRNFELEIQNKELVQAKKQAVIATDRYIELYDFAPAVYVTLSKLGQITKITQRGSLLLGKEKINLFYFDFEHFVTSETKLVFNDFFQSVFISGKHVTCEVALKTNNNLPLYVQIDAVVSENGKHCYMSLLEITDRVMAKRELVLANKELAYQNQEKEKRGAELLIANKELAYQNQEKEERAAELLIANKELAYQNQEKEKRAAELLIANKELAYQNQEKEKRAAELLIANKELAYQNQEKEKRAQELILINKKLSKLIEENEKYNELSYTS
jgi:hypothetical protein